MTNRLFPLVALLVGCSSPSFTIAEPLSTDDAGELPDVATDDATSPSSDAPPDTLPPSDAPPPAEASPAPDVALEASPDVAGTSPAPDTHPGTDTADASPPFHGDAACPAHDAGIGYLYGYCGPLGRPGDASSYSLEMATAAANAWPELGAVTPSECGTPASSCVVKKAASGGSCVVWCYSGPLAGKVHKESLCWCPVLTDTTIWN